MAEWMLGTLPAPHQPLQAPACSGRLRSSHPTNPKGKLNMSWCPLLPPKAAPQGAAGCKSPPGHPEDVQAGLRGCSSALGWEECPLQAPAKLSVLVGTRHKLLTDPCERLQPPKPCGNCRSSWLCSPALAEQVPRQWGYAGLRLLGVLMLHPRWCRGWHLSSASAGAVQD